eukprot:1432155-Karenia_brevis.AAC.3
MLASPPAMHEQQWIPFWSKTAPQNRHKSASSKTSTPNCKATLMVTSSVVICLSSVFDGTA